MNPHDGTDPTPTDHSDNGSRTVRFGPDEPISMSVVHAVANTIQRQPLDLEPLSTQIDPEALEALLSGPIGERDGLSVSFRFAGCTVVVTPTRIRVAPDAEPNE